MSSRRELVGALGALIRRIGHSDTIDQLRSGAVLENARKVYQSAIRGNIAPAEWTPFQRVPHGTPSEREIQAVAKSQDRPEAEVRELFARIIAEEELWVNETYQVSIRRKDDHAVHLSIKRIDQEPVHDWRDLQRIKNELVGRNCEAIELYPAESRRVDTANQYHLWATDDPEFRFPVGFADRKVTEGSGSHHQREGAGA